MVIRMNLRKQIKSNGRIYLSIGQSYRDPHTRKTRSKNIKSLGYVDELQAQYPDPIAHFEAEVKKMNQEESIKNQPVVIHIDKKEHLEIYNHNRKNFGYAALSKIYV